MLRTRSSKGFMILVMLILAPLPARAQSAGNGNGHFAQNAVYIEAFGQGVFYSLNYERRITQDVSLRGGITAWNGLIGFPLMVNALLGQDGDYFEIGVGLVAGYTTSWLLSSRSYITSGKGLVYGTATVGYRYEPYKGGFLFRIGFTPILAHHDLFIPLGGVSVGYAF